MGLMATSDHSIIPDNTFTCQRMPGKIQLDIRCYCNIQTLGLMVAMVTLCNPALTY